LVIAVGGTAALIMLAVLVTLSVGGRASTRTERAPSAGLDASAMRTLPVVIDAGASVDASANIDASAPSDARTPIDAGLRRGRERTDPGARDKEFDPDGLVQP
jgi:hypothetical protein